MHDLTRDDKPSAGLDRREFLRTAGAAALLFGAPALLAGGCSTGSAGGERRRTLRVGFVTPSTRQFSAFAEADTFVVEGIRRAIANGIDRGGVRYPVEILVRDAQSDSKHAALMAANLIKEDRVDLMLCAETPEIVNPVSDVCEKAGVPLVSSLSPWQATYYRPGVRPDRGYEWTYHYFFGLDEFFAVFLDMWDTVETNKIVGALWPGDADGGAFRNPQTGFPVSLKGAGYTLVDPGPYPNATKDFTAQIQYFKANNVEILTGVPLPDDFRTFWTQADKQGFHPKVASVGKALLFPPVVARLGELGKGLSCEVWWSPTHPFNSSLTGESARQLADSYFRATKRQWTQPLGFVHSLFEVAIDVLSRAADVNDRAAVRDAIASTSLDTMVGPISWSGRPVRNIAKTNLVGGQWMPGREFPFDLNVVTNKALPQIQRNGVLKTLPLK